MLTSIPPKAIGFRAAAVVGLLVLAGSSLGEAVGPEVHRQARDVREWAEAEIDQCRPDWAPELKALWAEGFEKAVLAQAREPLGDRHLTDIKLAITQAARGSYRQPPRAQFALEALVWQWLVGDIIATPPPNPADLEALKTQVRALAGYVTDQLVEQLEMFPHRARAATAPVERKYLIYIDQPKYRFDRRPMTEAEMQAARQHVRQAIEDARPKFRNMFDAPGPWTFEGLQARMETEAHSLALKAMAHITHTYLDWRHTPETDEFMQARKAASKAHAELRRSRALAGWVNPIVHLLASCGLGLDPVGDAPVWDTTDLPAGQAAMARQLRGHAGTAGSLRWRADIDVWQGKDEKEQQHSFEAEYTLRPGALRMVVGASPEAAGPIGMRDSAASIYEVSGDAARVLSPSGEVVASIVPDWELPAAFVDRWKRGPWEAAAPGPELIAVAGLASPDCFEWAPEEEPPGEDGLHSFAARAKAAQRLPDTGEVAAFGYWFDPGLRALVKVVALDAAGAPLWETVYDEFERLPDGGAIGLRSTTRISDAARTQRRRARRRWSPRELRPLLACEIVTEYNWLPDARLRIPVRRRVTGQYGKAECVMVFHDHEVEPLQDE